MPRTTLDIDTPVLRDLKKLRTRKGKSLGRVVSDLLARAISEERRASERQPRKFNWISRDMGLMIDLTDKDLVSKVLDEEDIGRLRL